MILGQISVLFGLAVEFVLVSLPVSLSLTLSFSHSAPSLTPSLSLSLFPVSLSLTLSFLLPASSLTPFLSLSLFLSVDVSYFVLFALTSVTDALFVLVSLPLSAFLSLSFSL
jgi:hypothetical protein